MHMWLPCIVLSVIKSMGRCLHDSAVKYFIITDIVVTKYAVSVTPFISRRTMCERAATHLIVTKSMLSSVMYV